MTILGSCLCGEVTYEVSEVDPNFWTGGLGVIFPFIKPPLAV